MSKFIYEDLKTLAEDVLKLRITRQTSTKEGCDITILVDTSAAQEEQDTHGRKFRVRTDFKYSDYPDCERDEVDATQLAFLLENMVDLLTMVSRKYGELRTEAEKRLKAEKNKSPLILPPR